MIELIKKSGLAGILIALAGWVFLICQNINLGGWEKLVGAGLFSIGLIAVILLQANLFTGKIGYVNSRKTLMASIIMLAVNLVAAFVIGLAYQGCIGQSAIMAAKLAKPWYRVLADSIGCGMCIYIAVEGYKQSKSLIPVILGVIVFIVGGFEHCVADMFYIGAAGLTMESLQFLVICILGNALGSLVLRFLQVKLLDWRK